MTSISAAFELIDVAHSEAAAAKAVQLIHEGKAELLMKGSLHTDELMRAVTASATGLRTARRISHVFMMDVPTYPETLFIADAAINIAPDLDAKRDIVQNAIDLFVQLGLGTPRVAILSAVETVTTKIPSTIEAAALCKMAERGQITGGVLDGPLAFDNAIDPEAAEIKGIRSAVAGRAQILIVPDLEAGNMLAKNLTFMLKADAAGLVLGARVPIVLTSRAELGADASCLLRCRRALCRCPSARGESACRRDDHGHDPGRQFRFLEPQVSGVRDRRTSDAEAARQRPDGRHRNAATTAGERRGRCDPDRPDLRTGSRGGRFGSDRRGSGVAQGNAESRADCGRPSRGPWRPRL